MVLSRLKSKRLPEIIESAIVDFILKEKLSSGDRLPNEKDMARQFGVSIATIREALRGLEIYGVIGKKRGKLGGIFVSNSNNPLTNNPLGVSHSLFQPERIRSEDLFQVIQMVNPAASAMAALRVTPKELQILEQNVRYCEHKLRRSGITISEDDFCDVEDKDIEFHALIAEATKNPVLNMVMKYTLYLLITYKKDFISPEFSFVSSMVSGHREIVNHLKTHDAQGAEEAMRAHEQVAALYFSAKERHQL